MLPRASTVAWLTGWALATTVCTIDDTAPSDDTGTSTDNDPGGSPDWPLGNAPIIDPRVNLHPKVATILEVSWEQTAITEMTWLEYSFEHNEWHLSPTRPGTLGEHREVVLGVPGDTPVQLRIVTQSGTERTSTGDVRTKTGDLPAALPQPTVLEYYPALASAERYMLGSVDGMAIDGEPYDGPFWLYAIDRQGRVVWYYSDLGSSATIAFPRVAPAGTHIMVEKRMFGPGSYEPRVLELALDWSYVNEIFVPDLDDCFDVTDRGTILYNTWSRDGEAALRELDIATGQTRFVWDCQYWSQQHNVINPHRCYSNTVNWNPIDDTVTMSMPYIDTVVEIDRASGELVGQYGSAAGSYAFEPSSWSFEFNHFANITPNGTLLVSSHMPGHETTEIPGDHAFVEFEIDRDNERLIEKWLYHGTDEWAMYKGMAMRLPNGNTLANYGTGGTIREITPDKRTAWRVKFDIPRPDDSINRMVGHNVLVDDLYALSRGPSR